MAQMQWIIGEFLYVRSGRRLKGPGGRCQKLSPKAAQVLEVFLARPGELLSYSALMQLAWGGRVVTECAVRRAVTEIRKNFGDDYKAPRYLETQPSQGYRWMMVPQLNQGDGGAGARESMLLPIIVGIACAVMLIWGWLGEGGAATAAAARQKAAKGWPRFAEAHLGTRPTPACQSAVEVAYPPLRY